LSYTHTLAPHLNLLNDGHFAASLSCSVARLQCRLFARRLRPVPSRRDAENQ
jgi:hypothetical protein